MQASNELLSLHEASCSQDFFQALRHFSCAGAAIEISHAKPMQKRRKADFIALQIA